MKPKVCFVTPPSAFLLDERVFPNLGVLKVAAAVETRGYPVEHLDLCGVGNYEEIARAHALETDASIFALTSTTPQMPAAARLAQTIRLARPSSKLVLGGPHPTLVNAARKKEAPGHGGRATRALRHLRRLFDYIVAGDGEDAIEISLQGSGSGGTGDGIVIDADDARGPLFLSRRRLEELPPPARHLIDLASYRYSIDGVPATSMVAQLGCPFSCGFCGGRSSPMLRRVRIRSTESVLAEIRHLYEVYGYRGFMFYDDELNVNPNMIGLMEGIAQLQKELRVEFRLRGFVKAELLTERHAAVMYGAGFRWLLCGFEAGDPRILKSINKKATAEDNERCVATARRAGLKIKALMSIGHPGESERTVNATKEWLLSTRPDDFDCSIITPYPGTPYYDDAVAGHAPPNLEPSLHTIWTYTAPETGDRLHALEVDYSIDSAYYKGIPGGGYVSHVFTDSLAPTDLVCLRDQLESEVRAALSIPFNSAHAVVRYEHSMGQSGPLPDAIFKGRPAPPPGAT
jgi:radical SAM superfamily enzyme YgiQ (UPF0313 family)